MQQKPSITLWVIRILATLWFVQLLIQIGLAGAFVSGDTDLFQAHSINGSMMNALPFFMVIAGLLHATLGRGRWWLAAAPVGLMLLSGTQETLGYTRVVGAHIVGGTLLFTFAALWCVVLWRHRYRPRPRRRDRAVPQSPGQQSSGELTEKVPT